MKKIVLLVICFMMSFTAGFVYAKDPLRIFVENREVKNNGEYIIKDEKVYVSEDALKRDFGFNLFYDKDENKVRVYNMKNISLEGRAKLFEEFTEYYEPKTSDEAAELWAKGVKDRNGVFQYVVLNKGLKEKFKTMAEDHGSWVTGFSSPWVESYKVTKKKVNQSTWEYKIVFKAVTSAPETYTWNATLIISKEDNKWEIIDIQKDFDIM